MNEKPIKSNLPKVDRLTDETIDYTDIPALDEAFLSTAVRVPWQRFSAPEPFHRQLAELHRFKDDEDDEPSV